MTFGNCICNVPPGVPCSRWIGPCNRGVLGMARSMTSHSVRHHPGVNVMLLVLPLAAWPTGLVVNPLATVLANAGVSGVIFTCAEDSPRLVLVPRDDDATMDEPDSSQESNNVAAGRAPWSDDGSFRSQNLTSAPPLRQADCQLLRVSDEYIARVSQAPFKEKFPLPTVADFADETSDNKLLDTLTGFFPELVEALRPDALPELQPLPPAPVVVQMSPDRALQLLENTAIWFEAEAHRTVLPLLKIDAEKSGVKHALVFSPLSVPPGYRGNGPLLTISGSFPPQGQCASGDVRDTVIVDGRPVYRAQYAQTLSSLFGSHFEDNVIHFDVIPFTMKHDAFFGGVGTMKLSDETTAAIADLLGGLLQRLSSIVRRACFLGKLTLDLARQVPGGLSQYPFVVMDQIVHPQAFYDRRVRPGSRLVLNMFRVVFDWTGVTQPDWAAFYTTFRRSVQYSRGSYLRFAATVTGDDQHLRDLVRQVAFADDDGPANLLHELTRQLPGHHLLKTAASLGYDHWDEQQRRHALLNGLRALAGLMRPRAGAALSAANRTRLQPLADAEPDDRPERLHAQAVDEQLRLVSRQVWTAVAQSMNLDKWGMNLDKWGDDLLEMAIADARIMDGSRRGGASTRVRVKLVQLLCEWKPAIGTALSRLVDAESGDRPKLRQAVVSLLLAVGKEDWTAVARQLKMESSTDELLELAKAGIDVLDGNRRGGAVTATMEKLVTALEKKQPDLEEAMKQWSDAAADDRPQRRQAVINQLLAVTDKDWEAVASPLKLDQSADRLLEMAISGAAAVAGGRRGARQAGKKTGCNGKIVMALEDLLPEVKSAVADLPEITLKEIKKAESKLASADENERRMAEETLKTVSPLKQQLAAVNAQEWAEAVKKLKKVVKAQDWPAVSIELNLDQTPEDAKELKREAIDKLKDKAYTGAIALAGKRRGSKRGGQASAKKTKKTIAGDQ